MTLRQALAEVPRLDCVPTIGANMTLVAKLPNVRYVGSSWQYRFLITRGGKREYVSRAGFHSADAAYAAYVQAKAERADNPDYKGAGKLTYGQYLERDWLPQTELDLKPTTAAGYRHFAMKHVIPALGAKPLEKITTRDVEALYRKVRESSGRLDGKGPLKPASVKQLRAVVRGSLEAAVASGLIVQNPAARVRRAKTSNARAKEMRAWTAAEDAQFRSFMATLETPDDRNIWASMFDLVLATGLRRSEALALRWPDVDFDLGTLAVRRGLTTARHRVHQGTTKTDRERMVDLDEGTVAMLKVHRVRQREMQMANAPWWADADEKGNPRFLVFCNKTGGFIHPTTASQTFRRRVLASGLPVITYHGMRHTHASILLSLGVSAKVIAERLGHADATLVLRTYGHVAPGMGRAAADLYARAIER